MSDRLGTGATTDLGVLALEGALLERHADHVVVRSPAIPDYHWGNCLHVTDPATAGDARRWVDRFAAAHPRAGWVAIGLPGALADGSQYAALGLEVGHEEVLVTDATLRQHDPPAGYAVRALEGDDWDLRVARQRRGDGDPSAGHERFLRSRSASQRRLVEQGHARFLGAFADGVLAADVGVVCLGDLARFQAVGTDPAHRRRGLASHLLGVAGSWARSRGARRLVIVADAGSDAARLYRSLGCRPVEVAAQAYRRPRP